MNMFLHILDIESGLCNLRCAYCFITNGGIEEAMRKGSEIFSVKGEKKNKKRDYSISYLLENVEKIIEKVEANVLVVLGGEIFLLPEVMDLLAIKTAKYDKVRIITNGLLIQKYDLRKLDSDKFCFQVSLDGNTIKANRFRFSSRECLDRILDNMHNLWELGFAVEINCVLSGANIDQLESFALYVKKTFPGVIIYPFPVRFFLPEHSLGAQNIETIVKVAGNAEIADVFPGRAYMEQMVMAIVGQKTLKCYLPFLATSGSEDGSINLCPCAMLKERGNIFTGDVRPMQLAFNDKDVEDVLRFKYETCKNCFTHFDIINLFIEGQIRDEEMSRKGMFKDVKVFNALKMVRDKINQGGV
jgi:sulfatase maturation enzyme AslB (radical SAM superfamily)